jgi:hypothetical protein
VGDTTDVVDLEVKAVRFDAEGKEKVPEQNEDAAVNEPEKKEVKKRKAMAPRSDVWDSYHKIMVGGILKKAKCKYCGRELSCHSKKMVQPL